nr:MAG TPA: hypothetical protein [Caudoviricetes sp.]
MSVCPRDKVDKFYVPVRVPKTDKVDKKSKMSLSDKNRDKVDKLSRMSEGQTKLYILRIYKRCPFPKGHRGEVVVRSLRTTTPSPDL